MKGLLAYSGVNTKIRAMYRNILSEDEFLEIVSLPDVKSVVEYLRNFPAYQEEFDRMKDIELHRGDAEFLLENSVFRDYARIYHFSNEDQRKFLKLYSRRYEIKLIKQCLSLAFVGRTPDPNIYLYEWFYDRYTSLDMRKLCMAGTVEGVLAALKDTEYYRILKRVSDSPEAHLFDYETALDMYHFNSIWKARKKIFSRQGCEVITAGCGTEFDLLNIWYVHRARRRFNMSETDTYALTIPIFYKLRKQELKALVEAETEEAFNSVLEKTYYGRKYPDFGPQDLGDLYKYVGRRVLDREAREHPNSIAVMYRYLYIREEQDEALTAAIECVRYGMPPEEAMKNLSAMAKEH